MMLQAKQHEWHLLLFMWYIDISLDVEQVMLNLQTFRLQAERSQDEFFADLITLHL